MTTQLTTSSPAYSITELNRLRDRAYREAQALRLEALQDFWRGTNLWVESTTSAVDRSAQRFANRMRRHASRADRPCAT